MAIETELEGYRRQIKKAQEQNEQLTYMQNRIEGDIAMLKKQIAICQNKHEALKIQYSTYSRTLHETEQQLNRTTTVCYDAPKLLLFFYTGRVNKNTRRLKKSCSLNIKAMMLKTVLFCPRYVKLGSVIYPALIGHSFPSK